MTGTTHTARTAPDTPDAGPREQAREAACCLCGVSDHGFWDRARDLTLVRCRRCGLIYVSPRPECLEEKNASIYNEEYFFGGKNVLPEIAGAQLKSCLKEKAVLERFKPGGRILDVGCGNGKFLRVLGEEWEKHGCDVSPTAVEFVRRHGLFEVRLGMLEELDYPRESFDAVYFRASLHHTFNPLQTLATARDLLAPDGLLAVSMSNNASGICGRLFKARTRSFDYGHTHFFSARTLGRLLETAGFRVVHTCRPYFGTGYESLSDLVELFRQYLRQVLAQGDPSRLAQVLSPPFYGNYVSMYAVRSGRETARIGQRKRP